MHSHSVRHPESETSAMFCARSVHLENTPSSARRQMACGTLVYCTPTAHLEVHKCLLGWLNMHYLTMRSLSLSLRITGMFSFSLAYSFRSSYGFSWLRASANLDLNALSTGLPILWYLLGTYSQPLPRSWTQIPCGVEGSIAEFTSQDGKAANHWTESSVQVHCQTISWQGFEHYSCSPNPSTPMVPRKHVTDET